MLRSYVTHTAAGLFSLSQGLSASKEAVARGWPFYSSPTQLHLQAWSHIGLGPLIQEQELAPDTSPILVNLWSGWWIFSTYRWRVAFNGVVLKWPVAEICCVLSAVNFIERRRKLLPNLSWWNILATVWHYIEGVKRSAFVSTPKQETTTQEPKVKSWQWGVTWLASFWWE